MKWGRGTAAHTNLFVRPSKMGNKAILAVLTLFLSSGCTTNSEPSTADRSAAVAAQTPDNAGFWEAPEEEEEEEKEVGDGNS